MSRQLNKIHCEFEFFNAIDGREEPHPLFAKYDDDKRRQVRRRPLSGGELGCWASHYLLWKKCIELNSPIVVLEDDVEILEGFSVQLVRAEKLIETLNYLRLAATYKRRVTCIGRKAGKEKGLGVVRYLRGPLGTQCYIVNPIAARRLLQHASVWDMAVDEYLDRGWLHGVKSYALHPISVKSNEEPGDIVRLEKQKLTLMQKVRFEFAKVRSTITRGKFNFKCWVEERQIKVTNFVD